VGNDTRGTCAGQPRAGVGPDSLAEAYRAQNQQTSALLKTAGADTRDGPDWSGDDFNEDFGELAPLTEAAADDCIRHLYQGAERGLQCSESYSP
jgi:hypothetical protein